MASFGKSENCLCFHDYRIKEKEAVKGRANFGVGFPIVTQNQEKVKRVKRESKVIKHYTKNIEQTLNILH